MRVVVVGAGLIGSTSAYHLARRGHEVTLLERRAAPALGASFANGGLLTPSMADPWNSPGVWRELLGSIGRKDAPMLLHAGRVPALACWGLRFLANSSRARYDANVARNLRLAAYSVAGMQELRTLEQLDYDADTRGTIKLYRDARAFETGLRKAQAQVSRFVTIRPLDAAGVIALEPGLGGIRREIAGGLHFPQDESGDAHRFTTQICEAAVRHGARLVCGADILDLENDSRHVRGVMTSSGSIAADVVVLAAGAETPRLLRRCGPRLPIAPVKGYSVTCSPAGVSVAHPPLSLPVVDDALHAAVTPLGPSLRIAGTAEFAGADETISPERLGNLKALLRAILPEHADRLLAGRVDSWAGLRPMCADGVPCIGTIGPAGLYVNTGHGHLGWTMADGSARLLADLIEGRATHLDANDYSPRRFA